MMWFLFILLAFVALLLFVAVIGLGSEGEVGGSLFMLVLFGLTLWGSVHFFNKIPDDPKPAVAAAAPQPKVDTVKAAPAAHPAVTSPLQAGFNSYDAQVRRSDSILNAKLATP